MKQWLRFTQLWKRFSQTTARIQHVGKRAFDNRSDESFTGTICATCIWIYYTARMALMNRNLLETSWKRYCRISLFVPMFSSMFDATVSQTYVYRIVEKKVLSVLHCSRSVLWKKQFANAITKRNIFIKFLHFSESLSCERPRRCEFEMPQL